MSLSKINSLLNENSNEIKFFDLRFTDLLGKEHHLTVPVEAVSEDLEEWIENGQPFDGSSLVGWKGIQASDMLLKIDTNTARIDPFFDHGTIVLQADVVDPVDGRGYSRCPRSIAKKAENYLRQTGIGDKAFFGPEPEFFIFDSVRFKNDMNHSFLQIESEEGIWACSEDTNGFNSGHRPGLKGGYVPTPPIDSLHDIRSTIAEILQEQGVPVEVHHHEVSNGGQCEIGTKFSTLTNRADWTQILKYVVKNVANNFSKTATFMPKPILGDNGSGMHVHQSIWKDDKNIFAGEGYAGLSQTALYYIGGIIKHAKALNALTNPSTNSYKRLVPHFEAPVKLAYSAKNRSASVRIPYTASSKARRIEVRFPDPSANPYLAFAALLMAGLDGILNKIDPGDPADKNLYDLPPEEDKKIPTVAVDLYEAIKSLDADREFLKIGGVFTDDVIDAFIELKLSEVNTLRTTPTPMEFQLYYSV